MFSPIARIKEWDEDIKSHILGVPQHCYAKWRIKKNFSSNITSLDTYIRPVAISRHLYPL
jgi:hypothetical protein